jgi:hypothetical protein
MLEILGLVLAIVDFCGLTETLEKKIDVIRQKLQTFTASIQEHQERTETFLRWFNGICFLSLTIYLVYKVREVWWPVRLILAPIVAFFGTGIYSVILILALMAMYYIVLWPLVLILRLLDMPKKGTIGSIGLLLAVVGIVVRFAHY